MSTEAKIKGNLHKYEELHIEMHNLMVPLDLSIYIITSFYQFDLILKTYQSV